MTIFHRPSHPQLTDDTWSRLECLAQTLPGLGTSATTVSLPEQIWRKHILDSLSALDVPEIHTATRISDIGAGAGFPGLVLAAALPQAEIVLIESSASKAREIEWLARTTEIHNVVVVPDRVESWAKPGSPGHISSDAVTVRAVAATPVLLEYAAPLLVEGGIVIAWKGARNSADEAAGGVAARLLGLTPRPPLKVTPYPGSLNHHLHVFEKTGPTPGRFPRRPGMALKRPLVPVA